MKTLKLFTSYYKVFFKWIAAGLLISLVFCITILLSSCAPSLLKRSDQAKIYQIKPGKTTRSEVEQLLGVPYNYSINPLTQEVTLFYRLNFNLDSPIHESVIDFFFLIPSVFIPHHWVLREQNFFFTIAPGGKVAEVTWEIKRVSARSSTLFSEVTSTSANEFDFAKVAEVREGKTTVAELDKLLGTPQRITKRSNEIIWEYIWFWQKCRQRREKIVFVKIDPQGKVKKVFKDSWRSNILSHGNSNVPLDRNNLLEIQVGKTTRKEIEYLLGQPQEEWVIERDGTTQTLLIYFRRLKNEERLCPKGVKWCFENASIMLDANGVVEGFKGPKDIP
ncbi:MAG: hypothetical protein JRJ62_12045 [Deltaproteobacteria bacterium]|nr:hypothetical protein [Deltaproteobacteria bacterium]